VTRTFLIQPWVDPRFDNLQRNHSCSTLSGSVAPDAFDPEWRDVTRHSGLFTLVPSGDLLERTPPESSGSTMTSSSYFRVMAFLSIALLTYPEQVGQER